MSGPPDEAPTKELGSEQVEQQAAESRLYELAAAIREHEATQRRERRTPRHPDLHLYRRLRQICGEGPRR